MQNSHKLFFSATLAFYMPLDHLWTVHADVLFTFGNCPRYITYIM